METVPPQHTHHTDTKIRPATKDEVRTERRFK